MNPGNRSLSGIFAFTRQGASPHFLIIEQPPKEPTMTKYEVVFNYQISKVREDGTTVPMHSIKEGRYDDMEYDDVVSLEGAIMGALGALGLEESGKKKNKDKKDK